SFRFSCQYSVNTAMSSFALISYIPSSFFLFFFTATSPTQIYTLSLHDALPISYAGSTVSYNVSVRNTNGSTLRNVAVQDVYNTRSEEHTSELQSPCNLVCRLLLEKKNVNLSDRRVSDKSRYEAR